MTLYVAPQAEADFAAIIGYLAEHNATAATEVRNRIFTVIDNLARDEFDGPEQTLVSEADHRRSGLSRIMSP